MAWDQEIFSKIIKFKGRFKGLWFLQKIELVGFWLFFFVNYATSGYKKHNYNENHSNEL